MTATPARPLYCSADFQAQQAFVAAGLGLSLLPSLVVGVRDDIVLRPLRGGPVRRIRLAFPSGAFRSATTSALVSVLRKMAPARRASRSRPATPRPRRSPTPR